MDIVTPWKEIVFAEDVEDVYIKENEGDEKPDEDYEEED